MLYLLKFRGYETGGKKEIKKPELRDWVIR